MALLHARQFYAATRYFRKCIDEGAGGLAWLHLAAAQRALGQLEAAAASLAKADALRPAHERAGLHVSRAHELFALHRDEEALHAAEKALATEPANPRAWLDKILALASLNRLRESKAALQAALAAAGEQLFALPGGPRRPEQIDPLLVYVDRGLQRQDVCAWHDRADVLNAIRAILQSGMPERLADPGILFRMLAFPFAASELKVVGAAVAARACDRAPRRSVAKQAAICRKRIRVGFLSPEFRLHPGAWLLRRLFLDRDRASFELFAYALNADDGSPIRAELAGAADAFVDMSAWAVEEMVRRMRSDELDLVIDNSGFFTGTRPELLAARVASVQAGFVGIPSTLGPGMLDYRLSDALTTPPDSQGDWYEKLVLLPAPHWVYDTQQRVGEPGTRAQHGLPDEGVVLCCFNQAFKITPELFAVWMRILLRHPSSVLWLLDGGDLACANLRREAQRAGVPSERLVFAPRVEIGAHLGRMAHADLFLDTLHCGAHTTAADALHAGLPVLTCRGATMASRLAATLVECAGLPDLVVADLNAYESRALSLAGDAAALSGVRQRLAKAKRVAPLFAAGDRVRAVERAFVAMVERHRAGLPPDTLIIE